MRIIYVLLILIPILGFEWVNIEDQVGDQNFMETFINSNDALSVKQKDAAIYHVHETKKGMSIALLIIKALLVVSIPLLIYSFYKNEKLST